MKPTPTTVRIDPCLKLEADAIFSELGITFSTAITTFLHAVVRERGMPFEMKLETKTYTASDSDNQESHTH